ncbi:MAG: hypothetical protein ACR2PL_04860 [Dehalococcoidia bacterium]
MHDLFVANNIEHDRLTFLQNAYTEVLPSERSTGSLARSARSIDSSLASPESEA